MEIFTTSNLAYFNFCLGARCDLTCQSQETEEKVSQETALGRNVILEIIIFIFNSNLLSF